jgi:ABC-type uncharacterized transport system substrate-binding protein
MRLIGLAVVLTVSLSLAPLAAEAQPAAKVPRLGVLLLSAADPNFPAFRQGLRDLGYSEGQNLAIDLRAGDGTAGRLADLAAELAQSRPDVILALGGDVAPFVKRATQSIPIVMMTSADPVKGGLVASLPRPGANVTGLTLLSADLAAKRIQFLREAVPTISRVGVIWNPDHADDEWHETQAAAQTLGIQIQSLEVRRATDFEGAFHAAVKGRIEAVIVVSSRLMTLNRARILELAARSKLPLVCGWGPWAQGGALISYGPDLNLSARRAATYVDRILKGAKPADLPVEQPTTFELRVNVKTAKAFNLTIPPQLLGRADQVIDPSERPWGQGTPRLCSLRSPSTSHPFAHAVRRMMSSSIVDDRRIVEGGRPNQ